MLKDLDIVYFVKESETNEELRYSLRSVEKNFPHRNVWFFGGKPKDLNPDRWFSVNQNADTKWGNTSNLLYFACTHPEISDDFVLFNDDFFIMKPINELPYYSSGSLKERLNELEARNQKISTYIYKIDQTWKMLNDSGYPSENYAMHIPMIINKNEMLKTFKEFPQGLMWRSIYGNHWRKPVVNIPDCKIYDVETEPNKDDIFLSTTDSTFEFGLVGVYIRSIFTERCKYEI